MKYRILKKETPYSKVVEIYKEEGLYFVKRYDFNNNPLQFTEYYPADDMGISYPKRVEKYENKTLIEVIEHDFCGVKYK